MKIKTRQLCVPLLVSLSLLAACGGKSESEMLESAKASLQKKEARSATIQLKNILQKNPQHGEARLLLGKALLATGDVQGAMVELRRALEYKQPAEQVVPSLAAAMLRAGMGPKLLSEFGSTTLNDKPAQASLLASLGMAAMGARDLEHAQQYIAQATQLDPQSEEAGLAQARLLAGTGKFKEAVEQLDGLLQRNPKADQALALKAELQWRALGQPEAAVASFKQVLALRPDSFEAHAALISLDLAAKKSDEARAQLQAMKKAGIPAARTGLLEAQVEWASGNVQKAKELVDGLRRNAPDHPGLLNLATAIELKQGHYVEAEALAGRAVQLAPNAAPPRRAQAQALIRLRQPAKALALLKPLLEGESRDAEALQLAGQAALLEGDSKAAEDYFKRAAAIKPDDPRIRAAVAMSQLGKGQGEAAVHELSDIAAADAGVNVDMALISTLVNRHDFAGALKAIDSLDKKTPNSPEAPALRGRVLTAQQNFAMARQNFEASLKRDAKYLPALAGLVSLDLLEKKPADAKARVKQFVDANPKNVQALLAMAELDARTGATPEQVIKTLGDAVRVDPTDVTARILLLDALLGQKDPRAALSAAQAATEALPNNVELMDRLARAQVTAGDTAQALNTFAKISAIAPESGRGQMGAARLHLMAKDLPAAQRDLAKVLEVQPDHLEARRLAIEVELLLNRPQAAMSLVKALQSRHPDAAAGWLLQGMVEQKQAQYDAAIASYKKTLSISPLDDAALRLHATLLQAKRAAEANTFADGWLKAHPEDLIFVSYLADQALAQGELDKAEVRYQEVLRKQPQSVSALNNLAWIHVTQKKADALGLAERAVAAAPDQPAVMDTYAMTLLAAGQAKKALDVQRRVVERAPDAPDYHLNLARYQLATGDKQAARVELQQLTKRGKSYPKQAEVAALLEQANR